MNMLRPAVSQLLKNNESAYSLVVAVAKRARQITEESDEQKKVLVEKPIKLAIEDFSSGKIRMVEADNIGLNVEE